MSEAHMVGMADIKVCCDPDDVLIALGVGAGMGICAYDAHAGVAGMAHVVLPDSMEVLNGLEMPGRFADTALPLLLTEMLRAGACLPHILVALIGGAQVFSGTDSGSGMDLGQRNGQAVQAQAACRNLRVIATALGGTRERAIHFFGNGLVCVKTREQGESPLVDFRAESLRRGWG